MSVHVLDDRAQPLPVGVPGELHLAGLGLAHGYLNRPELTAEKFPQHPRLGRVYRTGDLVHRASDGRFFYHGRIDSQVKLRGYRIELEAIESRLVECVGVRQAACRVQGDGAQQTLVGYVVPEDGLETLSFDNLKAFLQTMLPAYMVPSRFATLQSPRWYPRMRRIAIRCAIRPARALSGQHGRGTSLGVPFRLAARIPR